MCEALPSPAGRAGSKVIRADRPGRSGRKALV
ncbi:hypothetical protein RKD30_006938 [Streptomyces pristinaespiralis]